MKLGFGWVQFLQNHQVSLSLPIFLFVSVCGIIPPVVIVIIHPSVAFGVKKSILIEPT